MIPHKSDATRPGDQIWLWVGPLLLIFASGFYYVARYGGAWAENDSAVFADVIRAFAAEGTMVPKRGAVYANGYTYTALATFIAGLTGLDVPALQQIVFPLLGVVVVLPAWLLYRELTGSAGGAAIGTLLLLVQPEFLFVVLRSSHEKFTRALMLLCLYLLVRSLSVRANARLLSIHVGLFYVAAFALAASNNLLANSFFLAISSAYLIGLVMALFARVILRRPSSQGYYTTRHLVRRLPYVVLTCLALVYLLTFYVYQPATYSLSIMEVIGNDSTTVIVQAGEDEPEAFNAYSVVSSGWVSLPIYLLLSSANWVVLAASLAIWAALGLRWIVSGDVLRGYAEQLAFQLYAAFLLQGALAVLADRTATMGGNLQVRLFPSISIVAVGLVATVLVRWRPRRSARLLRGGLAAAAAVFALLAVLKATNEPAVSNNWFFYRPYELRALAWGDQHLRNTEIWTEFNERLTSTLLLQGYRSDRRNTFLAFDPSPTTRVFLISTITRLRSSRTANPLPAGPGSLLIYDNGDAAIYRLRPQTPYQR